ncbi:uncharacterized protein VTP21DRAFT_11 [Calcarisporiella thermophila]|uniref:uncharacterized protein n=1 Tax=Calcarisporiella thermophila TaxID=911321 RepID=UPI0037428816
MRVGWLLLFSYFSYTLGQIPQRYDFWGDPFRPEWRILGNPGTLPKASITTIPALPPSPTYHVSPSFSISTPSTSSLPSPPLASRPNVTFSLTNETVPSGSLFHIDLHCTGPVCNKLGTSMSSAARRIIGELNLRVPLRMIVTYHSFCTNGTISCQNQTLGWAAPASTWFFSSASDVSIPGHGAEGIDTDYFYPQSLAKQLSSLAPQWADYDIVCEINSDALRYMWFESDNATIAPHQFDMELVALHQIIHGLGFFSTWAPYFSSKTNSYAPLLSPPLTEEQLRVLTPPPKVNQDPETNLTHISGFLPGAIFDKYLVYGDFNYTLESLADEIRANCYEGNGPIALSFVKAFLNNTAAYTAAQLAWNLTATTKVRFRFPQTGETYDMLRVGADTDGTVHEFENITETGASESIMASGVLAGMNPFSHIAISDDVMGGSIKKGVTLNEIFAQKNATSPSVNPLAPAIKVLKLLGYSRLPPGTVEQKTKRKRKCQAWDLNLHKPDEEPPHSDTINSGINSNGVRWLHSGVLLIISALLLSL